MNTSAINKASQEVRRQLTQDIWTKTDPETPAVIRFFRYLVRWLYLVGLGFIKDQCIIRAAALTFTTILSIVPFLAVAFSISKGLGFQNSESIRKFLMFITTGRPEVVEKIIEYTNNTNVQALGWVGVVTLLFTVFSLIGTIEKAFNTIWSVKHGRTAWRKVADFFPIILICPMFILVALSFNVSLQQQDIIKQLLSVEAIGFIEAIFLKLIPYVLISLAFAFMYAFIPNIKVKLQGAALGGVLSAILWQMAQWFYINWQIGAAKYNAIYGSFAQLPVLLIWLYISWVIVLLGAEFSYAWQNLHTFVKQRYFGEATPIERQKMAVVVMAMLARRFQEGLPLPSVEEISDRLMAPMALISNIFDSLRRAGLVVLTSNMACEVYAPARPIGDIRLAEVLRTVISGPESRRNRDFAVKYAFIDKMFEDLYADMSNSAANVTMLELADKLPGIREFIRTADRAENPCPLPDEPA